MNREPAGFAWREYPVFRCGSVSSAELNPSAAGLNEKEFKEKSGWLKRAVEKAGCLSLNTGQQMLFLKKIGRHASHSGIMLPYLGICQRLGAINRCMSERQLIKQLVTAADPQRIIKVRR